MFDDTTSHNSDTLTAVAIEPEPMAAQPSSTDQPVAEHSPASQEQTASVATPAAQEEPHPSPAADDKRASEDFASALESFTIETEEAAGDDRVIKGTVLKLTATHVVVDIGTKSEGLLPLSEVIDREGKPKVKAGDEIDVMREKGQTEEGYVNLSHQKAARIHAWDEIEKAHHDKKPIKAVVIERTKGGLTVDILGARAFLPGSQVDLRPIRNLDGMIGQTLDVSVIKVNKKRGNIVVSRKDLL